MANKAQVIDELSRLVKEGKETILPTKWYPQRLGRTNYMVDGAIYAGWHVKALSFLKSILPGDSDYILKIASYEKNYFENARASITVLESVIEYIEKGVLTFKDSSKIDVESELERIFSRFFRVARQLQCRHCNRQTIKVNDEYDVQDLLHALLKLYFDDVRKEEWTPSYAGKSTRMDFLLKNEKTVIEVKKTRKGLTDKELGDQLIVDVDQYKVHPDCKSLVCFVYDPEGRIGNPAGMMKDLNDRHAGFVKVVIEPNK